MISETELTREWNEQKGKLKPKKDEILGKLQIRLGKTKEQLRLLIASL
jgi:hypothetical protein